MNWDETLKKLAEKVKPIHAFAILFVIGLIWALATYGNAIPDAYRWLIYITVIGVLLFVGFDVFRPRAAITRPVVPDLAEPVLPTDPLSAREEYLRAMITDCRKMRLVGLDPQAADPSKGGMTLEALYISLDTTAQVEVDKGQQKRGKKSDDVPEAFSRSQPLSALKALTDCPDRQIVLLGLPGTGKSTFVRYLALRMALVILEPGQRSSGPLRGLAGWIAAAGDGFARQASGDFYRRTCRRATPG